MKQKVINPFDPDKNHCFGCGLKNPVGLKLSFEETDSEVLARWQPDSNYQGYVNILHGGIISTILDEVAAWYVHVKLGTAGVTSEIKVKFLAPLLLSKGEITAVATLKAREGRYAIMECHLLDGSNKRCAKAEATFFIYPEEIAVKRFMYPGKEAFR